jgi:hypothetical protein
MDKQPNTKEPENFRELREALEQQAAHINKLVERMDPGSVDAKFGMILHQLNILGSGLLTCLRLLEDRNEIVIASSIKQANN